VKPHQADAQVRNTLKAFLTWAISSDGGQGAKYLDAVHFLPLPSAIVRMSRAQIDRIS
jgi:phosphate transport system substrate-binding protein